MKAKQLNTTNLVAKNAHKFNKAKVQDNELKALAKRACRGNKPSDLFWLI